MTEERFEEFLRREAREYNAPPPTPREEIWAEIRTKRERADVRRIPPVRRHRWLQATAAAAAVLLIGIGLGRWTAPATPVDEPAVVANTTDSDVDARVYRVAAVDHLGQLDTFISLFRSDATAGRADPETGTWARELLVTTRLMLDSPAANDTGLKELLEDLEFVLAQIAEYVDQRDETDLELIEEDLEQQDVLLRLQAELAVDPALPAQGEI